ncbi:lysosomal acid glucosylceramidase-like [Chrysoperla carnea]|uniref:lysosomal acid glucosylceramidase-like n=1 Tax=Chrysoperla carnea TaxID=189513 RepID=UPI001D0844E1|nr:lysosomal acid glucosylceramidase-like [Chrysoperla carnea]
MFCNKVLLALLIIFVFRIEFNETKHTECLQKSYGKNKLVCVCNAQQCDTIEPIEYKDGKFLIYTTSKSGLRLKRSYGDVEKLAQSGNDEDDEYLVELLPDIKMQQIVGWGGAFTDSTGINIKSLSEDVQDKLLQSYFAADGIEYNIGRVPIAGTDFSTRAYAYNEVPGDIQLKNFNLTKEDFVYKIPLIKKAIALRDGLKFMASAWSAPAWMKTNNALTGLGFLKDELYQTWANYHKKFLDMYKEKGIDFWAITTGNEPVNGLLPVQVFNSMGWTPGTVSKWIAENLGPIINESQHSNVKIFALDDQRYFLPWWIDIVFESTLTKDYVSGIGVHWYGDGYTPISLLDSTNEKYPDKLLLYTEACIGSHFWEKKVDLGSWSRGETYLQSIIETVNHWVTGWIDWNLALDEQGGPNWVQNYVDSPIIVNKTGNEFYKQPMFYAMGHVSKFIPSNSFRIGNRAKLPRNLFVLTVERPAEQRYVVVILNKNNNDYNIKFKYRNSTDVPSKYATVLIEKYSMSTLIF